MLFTCCKENKQLHPSMNNTPNPQKMFLSEDITKQTKTKSSRNKNGQKQTEVQRA